MARRGAAASRENGAASRGGDSGAATAATGAAIGGGEARHRTPARWAGIVRYEGWDAETDHDPRIGKAVARSGNPTEGYATIVAVNGGKIEIMNWDESKVDQPTRWVKASDVTILF